MGMVAAAREMGRLLGLYPAAQHAVTGEPSAKAQAMQERLSRRSDGELEAIMAGKATPG